MLLQPCVAAAQTTGVGSVAPTVAAAPAQPRTEPAIPVIARATGVRFGGDKTRTQVAFELTAPVKPAVFVLGDPYRVVIDVSDLQFRFAVTEVPAAHGLVSAWRYGLFAARKSRIVLDVLAPIRVERVTMAVAPGNQAWKLAFDIVAVDAATFDAVLKAQPRPAKAPKASALEDLPAAAGKVNARPSIVIDPGHGGLDPGTTSGTVLEKHVVLAVGRHLKAILAASGRYDVSMTRSHDLFVSLDQRLRLSQKHRADLFISIHADAVAEPALAQAVRGATVYTLSDQASDEQARLLAEKENAADLLAGVDVGRGRESDDVRNILVDLMKRETSNFSHEFSAVLVGELRRTVALAREPQRGAAFKVLKQTQTPAVLIELGYMSNVQDQQLLQSPEWQRQVASGIARAVDNFFAKRSSTASRQ